MKIGDFGLARLKSEDQREIAVNVVGGAEDNGGGWAGESRRKR